MSGCFQLIQNTEFEYARVHTWLAFQSNAHSGLAGMKNLFSSVSKVTKSDDIWNAQISAFSFSPLEITTGCKTLIASPGHTRPAVLFSYSFFNLHDVQDLVKNLSVFINPIKMSGPRTVRKYWYHPPSMIIGKKLAFYTIRLLISLEYTKATSFMVCGYYN